MATDMQNVLLTAFLVELEEFTDELENDIVALEKNQDDDELINKIFRAYHSIKSSAGIVGYPQISNFTHVIETLMEKIRKKELIVSSNIIDILLNTNDILKVFLDSIQESDEKDEDNVVNNELQEQMSQTRSSVQNFLNDTQLPQASSNNHTTANSSSSIYYYDISFKPAANFFETGNEPLLYIKDLDENGTIISSKINILDFPSYETFDPFQCYLSWNIILKTQLNEEKLLDVFMFILDDNDIKVQNYDLTSLGLDDDEITNILKEKSTEKNLFSISEIIEELNLTNDISTNKKSKVSNTNKKSGNKKETEKINYIKVNIKKLDELLNLVGEMVINYSQISNLINLEQSVNPNQQLANTMESFQRLTKEIQEKVMKVRMLPIGPTFNQFYRFVRDIAIDLDKKVNLTIQGSDTELDKSVIEKITDPLRHIVRNAIDHGLEPTEERKSLNKSEEGNIAISAYHREGNVIIEVSDDGRGLDKDKILQKAINKGLTNDLDVTALSDEHIYNFIFEPGFSTADTITDLSGRGVGMDVVKHNIEDLRGSIRILTEKSKGTTFRVILPLTLSIIEGMLISIGKRYFVINLMNIIEIIQPNKKDVNTIEEKAELINVRGEFLPLVRLHEVFDIEPNITKPQDSIIVIVESEKKKYCIMADRLLGQQQVVIKSMDKLLSNAYGITGTTILGDGQVAFILDIPALINHLIINSTEILEKV